MSDGAAQNGGTQAASTSEAAAVASATVAATAAAAPAATPVPAAPAAPVPPVADAAAAVPAAVAMAQAAPVPAPAAADCPPPKKKAAHQHDKKETEEEHARAITSDEDQNLSQPADGCVLPQTGQAAPAPQDGGSAPMADDGVGGGGINSGLLIGAGVLAAVGVGVLALAKGDDEDKNVPPVATADTGAVNEGATLTGSVATNDRDDNNDPLTYSLTGTAPAGLTLNSNGSYTFDANNAAYNALAAGATQVVTANYTVNDGKGGTASSTLTITVTGTNDAPVAVADTAAATEGGAVVTGSVATNDSDVDTGQTATLTYALTGTVPAGLTLNSNGTYSFDPSNPAYNSLAAGQTQTVVANYTVTDASGGTATSTLTITVTGTNDAPTVVADVAAVNEDATITGNLRTNDSDPDANSTLTYTIVGTAPAGLTLNADGTYTFNAANAAYQGLGAGQTQVVVANVAVSDGTAPAVNTTLTITVTGTNDAPVAVADVAAGVEGAGNLTGSVATNDSDPDLNAVLTYSLNEPVAGLTLNPDGTYSFNLNDAAYDGLTAGQTQVVVANYTVSDGQGGTATSTLTITVTGTADGPLAVADTAAATEGGAVVTGSLATNDNNADAAAPVTYSLAAPVAGLTVNADGTFSFDPTNSAYDALAAGQTQTVVANTVATDAAGRTSASTLTITVTGTNDAPVAVADTNAGLEDTTIAGSVATNDTDVDTPAANLVYSVVGTAPAGFVLNPNGTYTLDTTNAAYQNLTAGQVQNVVVDYQVSDGQGGVSTSTLTIAVTGVIETANLDIDNDNDLNTARVFDAGVTDFAFTDAVGVANTVIINNFGADDYITFDAPFSGANSVSFASGDYDNDGVADDLRITTNNGGVVSDIIITSVVDPNAVVFNEATAEAAVAGADNFRTTTQSATPIASSLDVDNDNNLTSTYVLPVAANTGTFAFTDSLTVANTVRVNDFGGDDTITFSGAVTDYSFASGDFDNDGVADDLRITSNVGGTVSDIVLTNSVTANAVVTTEGQAEAAIGAGFENFIFNGTVTPPPPPPPAGNTTASLDVDNDANLNTARVFDAAPDGFRFTDDADTANTVVITSFGTNDRIVLETGNTYSFSSTALQSDGDGITNDLIITLNKGGVVSEIVIKDAVDPNSVIFSEALAETALNNALGTSGVDYFQFA